MKKLLIVLVSIGLALGASAQKGHFRGGYRMVRPRVMIGVGGGFYSPFYNPYSPWSPYGYYSPYGNYGMRPSRLDLQIQDIKLDYADRIQSVKMDNGIKGKERRQRIRNLKNDRDKAIVDAKRNYYYNRSQR